MQKIRIKKTPKAGDQRDFSLVQRQAHYISDGVPSENPVKNTMGAVPEEKANIEVEDRETVVGDVNRDGFLEHMTFVGKRHSEGGIPVNIPEGSFIFSDTKKLKIKDKEALKTMFGLPYKKGGYTPAEIAKRYQINNFINDLKNPETDEISKRSASKMLQNNMEKLGMLALMQESMKGFPDGVPQIAESVMAGLQQQNPSEEQQVMKYGGRILPKAQEGYDLKYTPQTTIYVNGEPFKYESHYDADFWGTGDIVTFRSADGRYYKTNSNDLKDRINSGNPVDLGYKSGRVNKALITNYPSGKSFFDDKKTKIEGKDFTEGTRFYANGKQYEVLDPLAAYKGYVKSRQADDMTGKFYPTVGGSYEQPSLKVVELDKEGKPTKNQTVLNPQVITSAIDNNTFDYIKNPNVTNAASNAKTTYGNNTQNQSTKTESSEYDKEFKKLLDQPFEEFVGKAPITKTPVSGTTKTAPVAKTIKAGDTHASLDDFFNSYKFGGNVYQTAGTVKEETKTEPKTEVKTEAEPKSKTKPYAEGIVDGKKVFIYYEGDQRILKDEQGNVLKSTKVSSSFVPYQGDKNASKNPVTGKVEAGWNKSKLTPEEIDQRARARGYNGPKDNVKLQQWLMARPEYSKVINELHTKYGQPKTGRQDDGYWGVRWDDLLTAIPEKPSQSICVGGKCGPGVAKAAPEPVREKAATTKEEIEVKPDVPAPKKKSGTWWLQDIVNFTGTLTDKINRYEPTQGKINLQTPGYATLDPTRRLAANQEQFARLQNMTENTTDGNVGLAAMTGAQGQAFANAANAISEVENANVGIVNQAYAQNTNLINQEAGANEAGRQKYVEDMATLNQQEDNSLQQQKWRKIAAFNNGTSNWFRKKQMEQVLFPDINVDSISGDVTVDPTARDPLDYQTYSPAYSDGRRGSMGLGTSGVDAWRSAYDEALPTMGDIDARKYANNMVSAQMKNANSTVTQPTSRQRYAQAVEQGLMLPASEFGGTINYPWIDLD